MADGKEQTKPEPDQKLRGKVNYVAWLRDFRRAYKAQDLVRIFNEEEIIARKEPKEEDYIVTNIGTSPPDKEIDGTRRTRFQGQKED